MFSIKDGAVRFSTLPLLQKLAHDCHFEISKAQQCRAHASESSVRNPFTYLLTEGLDLALGERLAVEEHLNSLVKVVNLVEVKGIASCCRHFQFTVACFVTSDEMIYYKLSIINTRTCQPFFV